MSQPQNRVSDPRFKTIFDAAPDCVKIMDAKGLLSEMNVAGWKLLGGTADSILCGQQMLDFVLPEYHSIVKEALKATAEGAERDVEFEIQTLTKERRFIQAHMVRLPKSADENPELLVISRDITAARISGKALRESQEQLQRLNRLYALASSINALLVRLHDISALYASACRIAVEQGAFRMAWVGSAARFPEKLEPVASAGDVLGYFDEIYISTLPVAEGRGPAGTAYRLGEYSVSNAIHSDPNFYSKAQAEERNYRSCAAFPLKSLGKTIAVLVLYSDQVNFFNEEECTLLNQLAENISFAIDNFERERLRQASEQALATNEERFRLIVENSTDLISELTLDGRYLYASPAFKTVMGYEPAQLIGENALQWIHPEEREAIQLLFEKPQATATFRYQHQNGKWRWMEASGRKFSLSSGDLAIVIVSRDITEKVESALVRQKLEVQLVQSQKMEAIGRLAGGIAHDFNNLLAVINGYAALLQMPSPNSAEIQQGAKEILHAGEKAAALTRQLLTFSRQHLIDVKPVDLTRVIHDMTQMLTPLLAEDIDFIVQATSPCVIKADRSQLEQIILNLVVNARDAMPLGGQLTVACQKQDPTSTDFPAVLPRSPCCKLTVADTGTGIPKELQSQVFEPFFTTKGDKGTGLGLATVFAIVKQSQGHIQLASEPGAGTQFELFFPCEAEKTSEPLRPLVPSKAGSETILVVEDEPSVQTLIKVILAKHGYKPLLASSPKEAIELVKKRGEEIKLLLTDVVMPGPLTGGALAEKVKQMIPGLPVIFISGYSDDALVQRGVDSSTAEFLPKPFTPVDLLARVRKQLDKV